MNDFENPMLHIKNLKTCLIIYLVVSFNLNACAWVCFSRVSGLFLPLHCF